MSSVQRVFATPVRTPSKFSGIQTPCYEESNLDDTNVPIPFTVEGQTLDIQITTSSVQTFINNGNSPNSDCLYQAKQLGGKKLITQLGPNFIAYLNNRIQDNDGLGSPYSGELLIYVNPVMTKVQLAQPRNVNALEYQSIYGVNDQPPSSDGYVGGQFSDSYYSSWVFYSPLTVRYASSASTTGYRYMTFTTNYDNDN
jgi:hypothetical protein